MTFLRLSFCISAVVVGIWAISGLFELLSTIAFIARHFGRGGYPEKGFAGMDLMFWHLPKLVIYVFPSFVSVAVLISIFKFAWWLPEERLRMSNDRPYAPDFVSIRFLGTLAALEMLALYYLKRWN